MSLATLLAIPFVQNRVTYDPQLKTVWTRMAFPSRPSFNWEFMREAQRIQDELEANAKDPAGEPVRFHVLASAVPNTYCLGGDIETFARLIREADQQGMIAYAQQAIDLMHGNVAYRERCGAISISLVEGDALGGGFEAALSCDVFIAERGTKLGLPETIFNLFPGMGAYSFLSRRIGSIGAERMMLNGQTYSAEDLFEQGVIDILADPGAGRQAVEDYTATLLAEGQEGWDAALAYLAERTVPYDELRDVVMIWAETALKLRPEDVRKMERLVAAQYRRVNAD